MRKLNITIFIIFSLISVNVSVLKAMQSKNDNIQRMLSLAQYIRCNSSDLVQLNDCQEIPVRQIIQYIQEDEQGDNLFSSTTIQTLALTPKSILVEAYEIAVKNMHKPKILYSYDCHDDSFSDSDND